MRIACGGIEHESCSFVPASRVTEFVDPARTCEPDEVAQRPGTANTIVDGFIRGLRSAGVELVPLFWVHGFSGGQLTQEDYAQIKERFLASLTAVLPVDGVLLSLPDRFRCRDWMTPTAISSGRYGRWSVQPVR